MNNKVDISKYRRASSRKEQILRLLWNIVWTLFARPFPRSVASSWKRFILRLFGAKIHKTAIVYSSAKIYAPWNLIMGEYACIAPDVDCYNADKITIGDNATVSQKTSLCTASHDITATDNKWISAPVVVSDCAWIAAEAYIAPGVTVGVGAVVGARAAVFKDVEAWTVVGGNPAKFIKKREIKYS
ncbi:MAG: putative colanic acid biosynthesis acetyltransferase [Prevotellaceae bacterium]|jgi:putative colanic acid biosynthesis acetyltransferase WcaF|nr:putative colanic acid biosynthesis acetyltransferase [Prevotellaceae bacterium]